MGKKKEDYRGFVYSTDPDFRFEQPSEEEPDTLAPAQQTLRIKLDTKQRAGKVVTLVEQFTGKLADLDELGKKLKNLCGTGGSVKDGLIIIQGDHREKILQWLLKNGYTKSRKM